jgi:hypothetical protein
MLQKAVQCSKRGVPLGKPRRVVLLNDGEKCTGDCFERPQGSKCPASIATAYIVFNGVRGSWLEQRQDSCCRITDFHLGDPKATRRNNLKRS